MQSVKDRYITVSIGEGSDQTKTGESEKSIKVTAGTGLEKPSNPDEVKFFREQNHIPMKVHYPKTQRTEYSKSNPNIAE